MGGYIISVNDNSEGILEISITDVQKKEYVYWINIADLDGDGDVEDEAISAGVAFHKHTVKTELDVDEEGNAQVFAFEPFSRLPDEFTWVDVSVIKK